MFTSLTLRQRLLASIIVSGGIFLLIGLFYTLNHRNDLATEAMQERSKNLQIILQERLKAKEEFGLGLAVMLAKNQLIQEYLYADVRSEVEVILNDLVKHYAKTTNYRGLKVQIHTAEGKSWLRNWNPNLHGDDLLFRPSIQKMLAEKRPFASSDETGRSGFAVRGLAPIFYDGQYLGSLEVLQGVGSVSRDFEGDGQAYIMLLNQSVAQESPGIAKNMAIGDYLLANDRWFNERARGFASSLNLNHLQKAKTELTANWFATSLPILNNQGQPVGVHLLGEPAAIIEAQVAKATFTAWIFMGLLILLILGMGTSVALQVQRSVVRPIARSVSRLKSMENDLTLRLSTKYKDELGSLFGAFNSHTETLAHVIGEVTETANNLATAADQMLANSQQSRQLANSQLAETDQVASASNEMAASSAEMAEHADATLSATEQAQAETQKGQEEVTSTIKAINNLSLQMNNMLGVIERLDTGSQNIGKVIETISAVAEQTNLLALNAAIEAARAGEQGRGFAVVADEVRQLASRTQQATGEIDQIIAEVQAAATDVSKAIYQGTKQAEACVNQAEAAGKALDNISFSVTSVNEHGLQIAQAAREQNSVAVEISQSMVRINDLATESSSSTEQTQTVNLALVKRAEALEALVKKFKL
ncbi:methyl-accepting chemotaxis protein [Marinospirillum minutulum]|uniref:methyl-accepting chemotaxis protein n=1 Tax=Marinospirillum minutulum TaxID=64974 RepID=UPI0003FB0F1B|nr:methyl-accepting chemotaxis protein [Marinospirillum minutulum]